MNLGILLKMCILSYFIPSAFCVEFYNFEGHRFQFEELISYLKSQAGNRTNELEEKLDKIVDILTTMPKRFCNRDVTGATKPKSCADLRLAGVTCDGIYDIFPRGMPGPKTVKCDMTTDGGGWTILMKRSVCKGISFEVGWSTYKNGFGDPSKEFWIGNKIMHALSIQDDNVLRISLTSYNCEQKMLEFSSFRVGNESLKYELHVGKPTNATSHSFLGKPFFHTYNDKSVPFQTFDRRDSENPIWCAITGGWWYNRCSDIFLTGKYGLDYVFVEGVNWWNSKGRIPMKEAEMMIRPKNFNVNSLRP